MARECIVDTSATENNFSACTQIGLSTVKDRRPAGETQRRFVESVSCFHPVPTSLPLFAITYSIIRLSLRPNPPIFFATSRRTFRCPSAVPATRRRSYNTWLGGVLGKRDLLGEMISIKRSECSCANRGGHLEVKFFKLREKSEAGGRKGDESARLRRDRIDASLRILLISPS